MAVPRLCTEEDRSKVLEYISAEPEMNLFISGDIEQFGMDDPVNVYAFEDGDGSWDSIVLRFYANYVVYSRRGRYDVVAVADFVDKASGGSMLGSINGKYEVIAPLSPHFEGLGLRTLKMSRCRRIDHGAVAALPEGVTIRQLVPDDYDDLFALLGGIREYRGLYDDAASIALAKEQKLANDERGCVTYGAFENDALVSTAATSAASCESAMVVGVGTRADVRDNGLATAVVASLCQACFDEGKEFLCLFFDNPDAGKIYARIGFEEIGTYAMLR